MTKQPPCAQTQAECSNGSRGGQLQTKTSLGGRVQRGNHIQPIPRSLFYPATMSSGATGPRTFVLDCPQLITPPLLSNVYPPPRIPAILVLVLPSSLLRSLDCAPTRKWNHPRIVTHLLSPLSIPVCVIERCQCHLRTQFLSRSRPSTKPFIDRRFSIAGYHHLILLDCP
ncbi:hypothetical protein SCLCIDRAFT_1073024 [Scleroderma citrinum Foug A]|uniref:Uncharacterized protein n=1 Tax=Scleroderma citrinum Foug A TaxID=1036808 RepID=A0A0C3E4Y1_9AGAM|nr:hypothetical protein SCLCIDRAFT_1073024 [Scleroderma citrinum Foug A]